LSNLLSISKESKGIYIYIGYITLISLNYVLATKLQIYTSAEILAFVKSFGIFIYTLPFIILYPKHLKTKIFKWHIVRAINSTIMLVVVFNALILAPSVTQITLLGFIAPILASVLSIFLFKETFNRVLIYICLPLSILGGLFSLDLNSKLTTFNIGTLLGIISSFIITIDILLSKKISQDSNTTSMFYSGFLGSIIGLIPLYLYPPVNKLPHTSLSISFMFLYSFIFVISLICRLSGLKSAPLPKLMTADTLRLVITPILAYFILNQSFTLHTFIGTIIIITSILISIWSKTKTTLNN
jgi:drug/metabolite transporter (DMT)-like permease